MKSFIPKWVGGRVIFDVLNEKEIFLDFEPDHCVNDDGKIVPIEVGSIIDSFEICVYAERQSDLSLKFQKEIDAVRNQFSECMMWTEDPVIMAPTVGVGEERHNWDWQMFQLFRCVGRSCMEKSCA